MTCFRVRILTHTIQTNGKTDHNGNDNDDEQRNVNLMMMDVVPTGIWREKIFDLIEKKRHFFQKKTQMKTILPSKWTATVTKSIRDDTIVLNLWIDTKTKRERWTKNRPKQNSTCQSNRTNRSKNEAFRWHWFSTWWKISLNVRHSTVQPVEPVEISRWHV